MNKTVKPPRSILDPKFVWVPAANTDVRVTWEKARRAQQTPKNTAQWRKP